MNEQTFVIECEHLGCRTWVRELPACTWPFNTLELTSKREQATVYQDRVKAEFYAASMAVWLCARVEEDH